MLPLAGGPRLLWTSEPARAGASLFFAALLAYLAITVGAFVSADDACIRAWAQRDGRGTWLPGHGGNTLPQGVRIGAVDPGFGATG